MHKYFENSYRSRTKTAKSLKMLKASICRVIKRYKETLSADRKTQTNRRSGTNNKILGKKSQGHSNKIQDGLITIDPKNSKKLLER